MIGFGIYPIERRVSFRDRQKIPRASGCKSKRLHVPVDRRRPPIASTSRGRRNGGARLYG